MLDWDDVRLEATLAGLRDSVAFDGDAALDVRPPVHGPDARGAKARPARPARPIVRHTVSTRRVLAAAVAVLVVAIGAVIVAVPDAREAVARWLGIGNVEIRRGPDAPDPEGLGAFLDGVAPLPVDAALAELGPAHARLIATGLDTPTSAGRPPEGGVVVAWDDGAVTLWAVPTSEGPGLAKELGMDDDAELVTGIGTDIAVLVDGPHVMVSPVRRVAADRLVWWIDGDVQYRLEADRARDELLELARTLARDA